MTNRDKVIDWIKSGMDYNQGVSLLVEITHKTSFRKQYSGGPKQLASKLAYEICKASAVANVKTWKDFIDQHKMQPVVNPENQINPVNQDELQKTSDQDTEQALLEDSDKEYPTVIRRIVHHYASLFQERSKLHQVMSEMPQSNAEKVKEKRAEIFDVIKSLSSRLELFYEAKTLYEKNGTLPDENALFPPIEDLHAKTPETMDEASLKKEKKNLQSANSKDQFMLEYQSQAKKATKNPMPEGPKKTLILHRISQRTKEIREIEHYIVQHAIQK